MVLFLQKTLIINAALSLQVFFFFAFCAVEGSRHFASNLWRTTGAKALSSKMALEAPVGQFRRFHRKYDFCVFWPFGARIRFHSAFSGETPT